MQHFGISGRGRRICSSVVVAVPAVTLPSLGAHQAERRGRTHERRRALVTMVGCLLIAAASAFCPRVALPRCAGPRSPAHVTMQDPDHNVTSAFASTLAASPWLRQYAADSAERAAGDAAWDVFTPAWDAHLRLYPRKLEGWARVERAAALASAYWELIGHLSIFEYAESAYSPGQAWRKYSIAEAREKRKHVRREYLRQAWRMYSPEEAVSEKRRRDRPPIRMSVAGGLPVAGTRRPAPARRRTPAPVLKLGDKDAQTEAERKEKLRLLFGQDFPGAAEDKEPAGGLEAPAFAGDDDDPLAGRRVRKQQTTSDIEQLLDFGARFEGAKTLFDGVRKGGIVGYTKIVPGCICVARRDLPRSYIVCDQAYEVKEIYYQGLRGAEVERVPVPSLDARPPEGCAGYILYIKLFSQEYHTEPVTVRPEEVGIVSLGEEVWDSLKIGVPILGFWLAVISLLLAYGEASGGV